MILKEQNAHSREGKGRMRLGPSYGFLAVDFANSLVGGADCLAGDFVFLAVVVGIPWPAEVE